MAIIYANSVVSYDYGWTKTLASMYHVADVATTRTSELHACDLPRKSGHTLVPACNARVSSVTHNTTCEHPPRWDGRLEMRNDDNRLATGRIGSFSDIPD